MFCHLRKISYLSIRAGLYLKPNCCSTTMSRQPSSLWTLSIFFLWWMKKERRTLAADCPFRYILSNTSHLSIFSPYPSFLLATLLFQEGLGNGSFRRFQQFGRLTQSIHGFDWISRSGLCFKGPLTGLWFDYPFFRTPTTFQARRSSCFPAKIRRCWSFAASSLFRGRSDCILSRLRWRRPSSPTDSRAVVEGDPCL